MICPRRLAAAVNQPQTGMDTLDDTGETRCKYCGSLLPEVFLRELETGTLLTPTNSAFVVHVGATEMFRWDHLNAEQQARFIEKYWEDLPKADARLRLASPGYFPVWPYFIVPDHHKQP